MSRAAPRRLLAALGPVGVCAALTLAGCAAGPGRQGRAPVGPVKILASRLSAGGRYAGSASCRPCHPGPWERWAATGHAAALAGLGPQERVDPSCLRCHATGYGELSGYGEAAATGLDAVGCEACHGPGADHAGSRWPALVPPPLPGECAPCDANRACRACHTPGRSPGFDLARDLARVSCR